MNIEQLKNQIRDALQAGAEYRSGLGAQTGPELPDHLDTHQNLRAAELLSVLADDVEHLDLAIAESFLTLIGDSNNAASVFETGAFAGVVSAIGMPSMLAGGRPWRPETANELLSVVVEHTSRR